MSLQSQIRYELVLKKPAKQNVQMCSIVLKRRKKLCSAYMIDSIRGTPNQVGYLHFMSHEIERENCIIM